MKSPALRAGLEEMKVTLESGTDHTPSSPAKPTSVAKQIRFRCLDCAGSPGAARHCEHFDCELHAYRFGRNPYYGKTKREGYKPPLKSVRAHCLSCCNGSYREVRKCPAVECAIHPLRMGKRPRTQKGVPAEKRHLFDMFLKQQPLVVVEGAVPEFATEHME